MRGADGEGAKRHLWAILSSVDGTAGPDQLVLIVNFTSWQPVHDQTCVLEPGDHPFITGRTCVNYQKARLVTLGKLAELELNGLLERRENLDGELLQRIRNLAANSRRMPRECFALLEDQGLVAYDDLD